MSRPSAWWSCDGAGHLPAFSTGAPTRRKLLGGAAASALAVWAGQHSALAGVTLSPDAAEPGDAHPPHTLVVVFLRGGADGLALVPPYGEDAYHRLRPTLGLASPKDRRAAVPARSLDLDGFFGLHPSLAPLRPLYAEGQMGIVHAVGSPDDSHSHFEAMAAMESGLPSAASSEGWVARYLSAAPPPNPSPLRGVAFGPGLPDSLRGATHAVALESLADFRLSPLAAPMAEALAALHATSRSAGDDPVRRAGRNTLHVLKVLQRLDPALYRPAHSAVYPQSELGDGLRQTACLIRARVGLEAACLDHQGPYLWDTHVAQPGVLAAQAADLAGCLAAFAKDLGAQGMRSVTVIAMTEFGRRAQENSGLGTDHGQGSVLFALGGGIHGGEVYGAWPGLEPSQLEGPGDLRVTTDYRQVLAEIVAGVRGSEFPSASLFAGMPSSKPLGIA
ncbi:MAG: DUF1501 domain-containing protein [Cytophagales bacterium]|nr:DUF1501 domain-containing protein [Armatimonadota bacterium]